jgi:hypothetical protein
VLKALKPLAQLIHRHSINSESDFFSDVRVQAKSIPGWNEELGEAIKLAFAVTDERVVLRANNADDILERSLLHPTFLSSRSHQRVPLLSAARWTFLLRAGIIC